MNILYIIGNGFDINLGLKTGYPDFYDYYLDRKSNSALINNLKEHLKSARYTTWADLELGMGDYTRFVPSCEAMVTICHDLSWSLRNYLSSVQNGFSPTPQDIINTKSFLAYPSVGLSASPKRAVDSFIRGDKNLSVISFNYTNTFERLCGFKGTVESLGNSSYLKMVQHIHMSLDNTDVILGVNDESQIANNEIMCSNLLDAMVKPHINKQLGTLVDDECVSIIKSSDLICLFGVSLGKSDNIWWRHIGKRLTQSEARLIYYAYDGDSPMFNDQLIGKRRYYMDLLKRRCALSSDNASVENRIFIGYKTGFFKIR